MNKNKEKLYSKTLEQMNKQFKKRGIQFSFVKSKHKGKHV
jgi:O-acetylhomoserine/O-acetylserine sulfhydrylase-like pyridoxal-dependent enzyme